MRYNINTSVVCLLAIVVCFIVTTTTSQSQSADLVEDRRISERPVQVHRRKRNLGEVILSAIPIIGGIFRNRKAAEAAARRHDESMRMQLHQLCTAICVSEWSAWGACSQPCGGGTSERTRTSQTIGMCADLQNFECPHSLRQTAPCNPDCAHGGLVEGPGQCQCTPSWTGQCCQQEVRCPYPGRPEHGEVSGTWPARYQTVASFTCHTGYVLDGNSDSECLTSGQWSRPKPACHRIVCSAMQAQPHVVLLNPADHYFVGEELIYICDEGYSMQTPENSRECRPGEGTQGRWSGIEPRCIPVSCSDPGFPVNGARTGEGFLFGNTWQYTCNEGYTLIGSPELTCMATGYWLGTSPSCEQIMCEEPYEPENGAMRLRNPEYGAVASFTCHEGYRLEGPSEIECMTDGEWSNPEPVCEAAMCVDPVVPQNGAKDGGLFYFPHSVTYHCFNGYVLQGVDVLQCTASGAWSGVAPSCEPCSSGTYMEESSPGVCQQCPLNSHTTTDASTSREQCVCDEGYAGPPGGPCEEILCSVLTDPAHGYLSESCGNIVNSSCHFACEDGFIISRGSGVRTCQNSGLWDGQETICTACGRHTYKNSEQSCLPCPQHSHTQGEASMRADCQCDDGYESSVEGLCSDVNECLENDGKGPCNDICENRDGGFQCACSIQGHAIKPEDPYNCVIERQCRNLTEAEAPENGGLLCHWYLQENSQQCSIRCNSGYEFPTRTNDYETCGPSTSYVWTFRTVDRTAQLEPCLEEFFPDFQLEASSLYFVSACQDMTDEEKEDVYLEFARRLEAKGLCQKNAQRVCDISHMAVICGNVTTHSGDRKRRDASQPADLGFGVKALKREEQTKDCSQICIFLRIPSRFCNQLCVPTYKRFLKASVLYARRQLQNIYRNSTALRELAFSAAHRQFNPAPRGLRTSEVEGLCPNGMGIANDNCIMCKPGTFLSVNSRRCEICPVGTYQPLEGHSACVPCPPGTNSNAPGSSFCTVCPPSHYGDRCTHTCQCVHGTCDPRDGTCSCDNGWTGPTCDTDVDGCHEDSCLGATTCLDIPAPGSGFQCVSA